MTSARTLPRTAPLAELARHYAADPDAWPLAPRFQPARRWHARIHDADDHEAWLLTWLPGQGTELHDHGGSAGAFTVVRGALVEYVPAGAGLTARELGTGSVRAFGARHIHQVVNAGPVPAISVHVYAPALRLMNRYDLDGGLLRPAGTERAGADW